MLSSENIGKEDCVSVCLSNLSRVCVCVFQTLPDSAVSNYAASLRDKGSLVPALYKVIRENYSDVRAHTRIPSLQTLSQLLSNNKSVYYVTFSLV